MGLLGLPFIFGPVSGGDTIPPALRKSFSQKDRVKEKLRDLANWCVRIDPTMWASFEYADSIYITSQRSSKIIPARFRKKTKVRLAIGIPEQSVADSPDCQRRSGRRILYAGNLLYLKGLHLGLAGFAKAASELPGWTLTLVGDGPEKEKLLLLAEELGIRDRLEWKPAVSRDEILRLYPEFDIFLFPSLRDSGGMVVLEALASGVPVVCLNLGGPAEIVNETCGFAVNAEGPAEEVIANLASALRQLAGSSALRTNLAYGALSRAREFTWERLASELYSQPFVLR